MEYKDFTYMGDGIYFSATAGGHFYSDETNRLEGNGPYKTKEGCLKAAQEWSVLLNVTRPDLWSY